MIGGPVPESVVYLAIGAMLFGFLIIFIRWVRDAPLPANPWESRWDELVQSPDAVEVCHHCSTPQEPGAWFCPCCGRATGPYNNIMPYVCVFSQGEVLRNGVGDHMDRRPLIVLGYFLLSLSLYLIFAPIYWYFLFQNLRRGKDASGAAPHH